MNMSQTLQNIFLMVLMIKSWWFVMVFVVETIRIFSDGSIVFLLSAGNIMLNLF